MTKRKWKMVGRPEPAGSGQRFFIRDEGVWDHKDPEHRASRDEAIRTGGVHLYVADNSGTNPDNTDEGPLILDRDEPIQVGQWCGRIGAAATVLVMRESKRNSQCGLTMKEAAWLVEHAGMRVEVNPKVLGTFEAYAKLHEASRKAERTIQMGGVMDSVLRALSIARARLAQVDPNFHLYRDGKAPSTDYAGLARVVALADTAAPVASARAGFVAAQDISTDSLRAEDNL